MKRLIEIKTCSYASSHINDQFFLVDTLVSASSPLSQALPLTAAQLSHLEATL